MEDDVRGKNEFYARLTVHELEELAVHGDARAQFELGA